jgi:hypothetical protein
MSTERSHQKSEFAKARSYDANFYTWTDAQASILRRLQPAALDWRNLIEEMKGLARADEREHVSQLAVLLMHLLKWRYQPNKRNSSWEASIENARGQIDFLLQRSPSLATKSSAALDHAYRLARRRAGAEMGWSKREWEDRIPVNCDWL